MTAQPLQPRLASGSFVGAALAITAFAVFFYRDTLLSDHVIVFRDTFTILFALEHVVRSLSEWSWPPLWNPYQSLGKPLAAEPLAAVYYPINWPLRTLPQATAFNVSLIFHHCIAALGFLALLSHRGLHPIACCFGALLFSFGGFLVSYDNIVTALQSAAWLPWGGLAFSRWRGPGTRASFLLLVASLAMVVLGGMPEMLLFANVGLVALAWERRDDDGVPAFAVALAAITAANALAALLCAVHLVPLAEYLAHSSRADGLRAEGVLRYSLRPLGLLAFLVPRRYWSEAGVFHPTEHLWDGSAETPWAVSLYLGPIAAAAIAALPGATSRPRQLIWPLLGVGFVLLALGEHLPGYRWAIETLPPLRSVRYPEKFLLISHTLLAAAAATGLDAALRRRLRFTAIALAAAFLVLIAMLATAAMGSSASFAAAATADLRSVAAILALVAIVAAIGRRLPLPAAVFLLILTAADLYRANAALLPSAPWREVVRPPRSLGAMQRTQDPLRIYSDGLGRPPVPAFPDAFLQERDLLWMEIANYHGIANLNAPASINLRDHERLAALIEDVPAELVAPLLASLNTAYVTSPKRLDRYDGLTPVLTPATVVDAYVYRVESVAPRAFVAAEVHPVDGEDAALRYLRGAAQPARRVAVLQSDVPVDLPERMRGEVEIVSYLADRVELAVDLETAALVVLSDSFYPGWSATVDGVAAPIVRANHFARGIFTGNGRHRIVFAYEPLSHRLAGLLSATAVALFLAATWYCRQRHERRWRQGPEHRTIRAALRSAGKSFDFSGSTAQEPAPRRTST